MNNSLLILSQELRQTLEAAQKYHWRALLGIGMAAIALVLLIGNFLFYAPIDVRTVEDVRNLIVSDVHNVSELTTVQSTIKATVVLKEEAKAVNVLPLGNTNLVYEGVGTVYAGINPSELKVLKLDASQHSISLLLPAPHINTISLNLEQSSTLANYRNWFGPKAGPELYEKAQRKAIAEIRKQACANQILNAANSSAAELVKGILTQANFKAVQISTQTSQPDTCPMA